MLTIAPSIVTEPPVCVQLPPTFARQPPCASTAAERMAPNMACALAARAWVCMAIKRGSATAARIPTMAIVTTSSISVNPEFLVRIKLPSEPPVGLHQLETRPLRQSLCAARHQHYMPGNSFSALFIRGEILPQINEVYDFF